MAVDALLLLLTFSLGAALSRVSLCAVAGLQQLVVANDYAGLQRLLLAACGAGVALLLLAGAVPQQVLLPADTGFHAGIVVGGLLLGFGALLNGGCYLGSVLYLGSGNLNFLLTLVGIGLGSRCAERLAWSTAPPPGLRMPMGLQWLLGCALFTLIAAGLMSRARFKGRFLALLAGLLAGVVYARHPAWSYGAVIESLARGRWALMAWLANVSALMLFAGALVGAWLTGRYQLQNPTWRRGLRCLAGGTVMGLGAGLVPGGNDTLLLWAIPGLTWYGTLAYLLMLIAIITVLLLGAWWQRHKPLAR